MNKIILSMGFAMLLGNTALASDHRFNVSERRQNTKVETPSKNVEKEAVKDCHKSEKNREDCCKSAKVEGNQTQVTENSNC